MHELNIVANKTMFQSLATEHLVNMDLRITCLEATIEGYMQYVRIFSEWFRSDYGSEEAEVKIADLVTDISNSVQPLFLSIEAIKKEREAYISNPRWPEFGGVPAIEERTSVLQPDTVRILDTWFKNENISVVNTSLLPVENAQEA